MSLLRLIQQITKLPVELAELILKQVQHMNALLYFNNPNRRIRNAGIRTAIADVITMRQNEYLKSFRTPLRSYGHNKMPSIEELWQMYHSGETRPAKGGYITWDGGILNSQKLDSGPSPLDVTRLGFAPGFGLVHRNPELRGGGIWHPTVIMPPRAGEGPLYGPGF